MAALGLSSGALAAPTRIRFQIEAKPYSEALLDLAQQANVTLIGAASCTGVSSTAAGQHLRSDDTHYTNPGLGLTRSVRIPEPHINDIESATATLRRSWGWGELTASTGYVRHAYGSLYDATATQRNYSQFALTSAYVERARTRMFVQDLVLTSRGAGRLEWLAGL